jgi:hypothetical protein
VLQICFEDAFLPAKRSCSGELVAAKGVSLPSHALTVLPNLDPSIKVVCFSLGHHGFVITCPEHLALVWRDVADFILTRPPACVRVLVLSPSLCEQKNIQDNTPALCNLSSRQSIDLSTERRITCASSSSM